VSTRAGDRSSTWQAMRHRHHQGRCGISPSAGGSTGPPKGEAFQEILCTEERYWQRRGEGQQLGRTRHRERQGSTGRAGRSKEGERLAIRLFIDELLLCYSLGHCRHQPHRHGSIALI